MSETLHETVSDHVQAVEEEESNLVKHARRELAALGNGPEIDDHVIQMISIFSAAGHSGYSGFYTIGILEKLLRFENLTELTDDPDEWYFHGEEMSGYFSGIWQNVRNGEAFSFNGGKTYYLLFEIQGKHRFNKIMHNSKPKEGKPVAVKHKPYKNKSNHNPVRAIRVTARNYVNVSEWAGGNSVAIVRIGNDGQESNHRVKVNGLVAQVGDFVVREEIIAKGENGKPVYKFFRVKDDTFEAEYAAV